jgi:hypothetical protein
MGDPFNITCLSRVLCFFVSFFEMEDDSQPLHQKYTYGLLY